jgi:hypothetical protein
MMHHTIKKCDVKDFLGSIKYNADNDIFFTWASAALAQYELKAATQTHQPQSLTSIKKPVGTVLKRELRKPE